MALLSTQYQYWYSSGSVNKRYRLTPMHRHSNRQLRQKYTLHCIDTQSFAVVFYESGDHQWHRLPLLCIYTKCPCTNTLTTTDSNNAQQRLLKPRPAPVLSSVLRGGHAVGCIWGFGPRPSCFPSHPALLPLTTQSASASATTRRCSRSVSKQLSQHFTDLAVSRSPNRKWSSGSQLVGCQDPHLFLIVKSRAKFIPQALQFIPWK